MNPDELANKCSTVQQAQNLIRNAQSKGRADIVKAAERRLFELQGRSHDDPDDPLTRAVWEMIHAYENIVLKAKHGRAQAAARTRQFVRKNGAYEALLQWARRRNPTEGFNALVDAGHADITAEYMVAITYASRFPEDAKENALERLRGAGVRV